MKTAASSVNGGTLRADVAIVGAGPAGLTLARELAGAGLDVALIESGTERRHSKANELNRGTSAGYAFPLATSRNRAFGGTSGLWRDTTGLRVRPLDAMDLDASAVSGAPGWPVSFDELQKYYAAALDDLQLPCAFEPADRALHAGNPLSAFEQMFLFGPHDHFVAMRDAVERSPRINLVLDATVTSVETTGDGRAVRRLSARSLSGSGFSIEARRFILASGGLENPRILLASRTIRPNGVANQNDLVGRFFMDHISQDVAYLPGPTTAVDVAAFQEHSGVAGKKAQAMFALPAAEIRTRDLMNAAVWIAPVSGAEISPGVRAARSLRYSFGARPLDGSLLRRAATAAGSPRALVKYAQGQRSKQAPEALAFRIMAEQAPNADSRVMLASRTDALGMPRMRLNWKVSDIDRASIRGHIEGLAETFRGLGLGSVHISDDLDVLPLVANHHHMGTTRMHVDPRLGVVDSDCRTHEVANLFIAGSSVFPSGGYVNPTLTILALARRLAETVTADLAPAALTLPAVQPAVGIPG